MTSCRSSSVLVLAILLAALARAGAGQDPPPPGEEPTIVVYLVRHADKGTVPAGDPALSPAGEARAEELARVLGEAGIEHVHSSDFRRTRDTAKPIAERLGLDVELYDPFRLGELAAKLRATPGRHLVVGHSDTTTEMVHRLGGEPGSPIADSFEFDRLYAVVLVPGHPAVTLLERYGAPSTP